MQSSFASHLKVMLIQVQGSMGIDGARDTVTVMKATPAASTHGTLLVFNWSEGV